MKTKLFYIWCFSFISGIAWFVSMYAYENELFILGLSQILLSLITSIVAFNYLHMISKKIGDRF